MAALFVAFQALFEENHLHHIDFLNWHQNCTTEFYGSKSVSAKSESRKVGKFVVKPYRGL